MVDRQRLPTAGTAEVKDRIRASFARQSLMAHLGAQLRRIGPKRVRIASPHQTGVTQQHGSIHAGEQ